MSGYGPVSLLFELAVTAGVFLFQSKIKSDVQAVIQDQVSQVTFTTETADSAAAVVAARNYEILDANGRPTAPRKASTLLTPDRLSDQRRARLARYVDPADLLKPGEAMPDGEMQALMVEARSARLADAACMRLIAALATECAVSGFKIEKVLPPPEGMDDARAAARLPFVGQYLLTTSMMFTPRTPVGTLPEGTRVTYHEKRFRLDPWTTETPAATGTIADRADALFAAAARACDDIRAIHGNCTVVDAGFSTNLRELGIFDGAFDLAWLTPVHAAAAPAAPANPPVSPVPQ